MKEHTFSVIKSYPNLLKFLTFLYLMISKDQVIFFKTAQIKTESALIRKHPDIYSCIYFIENNIHTMTEEEEKV